MGILKKRRYHTITQTSPQTHISILHIPNIFEGQKSNFTGYNCSVVGSDAMLDYELLYDSRFANLKTD